MLAKAKNELNKNSQRMHLLEVLAAASLTAIGTLDTKYGILIMAVTLLRAYAVFNKQKNL